ncbi:MAG: GTPase HflX, partial [Acetobacterium sp.]|nr:GTPase HflX [Acetobacterium sp.]
LMEVETADLLLHVVDVSNHNYEAQITVVNQVLADIGAGHKKVMTIYNKIDKLSQEEREAFLLRNQGAIDELTLYISAKEGAEIDLLFETVSRVLIGEKRVVQLLIPYDDNKSLALLHEMKVVQEIDYQAEGNLVTIEMTDDFPTHLFEKYQVIEV